MTPKDHLIWTNDITECEETEAFIAEEYPWLSEKEQTDLLYEMLYENLEDERVNLNIQLSRPILVIGNLGLWQGRVSGYKEIPSGNIRDCLYSDCDYSTWYMDSRGDLRCDDVHHDGTNHYLYRTYKDGVTEEQIDRLKEKIYRGTATRADITRLTRRLGDEIAAVYGWELPPARAHIQKER